MLAGDLIDGRFEIEHLARSGGMGHVYRGLDLATGEAVALKVLQNAGAVQRAYFDREVEALRMARVPGVVRYVAHGLAAAGQPYLAMEWLTGETLTERLARSALSVADSVDVVGRIAATLGAIHRQGIVHGDLKPSNLLLVGGAIDRVTLIDFGIARLPGMRREGPTPGVLLGTPEYMAPELVRGDEEVDARVDVFALGAVLFRCLTGRTPFQGAGALAILAKVLLDAPPALRDIRPDAPPALEALIERMLSKPREGRPRDGAAVMVALGVLDIRGGAVAQGHGTFGPIAAELRATELTDGERRVMCLVLARDKAAQNDATRSAAEEVAHARALRAVAQRYQGQIQLVEASSPLIVLASAVAATDLAARAARCALEMQALLAGAPVVLVTGRAELAARLPVGELVERALELLPSNRGASPDEGVRIDEVTARLLGPRFDVEPSESGGHSLLRGAQAERTPQSLLGKLTPCLGREREIEGLATEVERCVAARTPFAVLVTGAAGMGKSRLTRELVHTLRARGARLEVWVGQSDPMRAGSAFELVADAIRRAIGLCDGDPLETRRRKLLARVEQHRGIDILRVAVFLGELASAPFPDDADAQLQAARRSPILMGDQLRRAFEDFLRAECAARPVLLVLEDLHWGDRPSISMVEAALRNLVGMPLMVVALGRPEVRELFPTFCEPGLAREIALGPLPRAASEELVRRALGDEASEALIARLVEHADGNAFFLEEQIRAAASGKSGDLPETVLAMVQARLEALSAQARRALRAASIFGQTFTARGVAALVGGLPVAKLLPELVDREVIVQGEGRRRAGEAEYRFQHALVREAAYGMLTEADRRLGHALAAEWIERQGDADPMALAEHFERGGAPGRASASYLRAAQQSLRGNDLGAAIERAERGITCGAAAEAVGLMRLVQAEAHVWRGDYALAETRGEEAAAQLAVGSAPWFSAVTQVVYAACRIGAFERVERWMTTVNEAVAAPGAESAKYTCLCAGAATLAVSGSSGAVDALIGVVERATHEPITLDIQVIANLHQARTFRAMTLGDPGACLEGLESALAAFELAGDRRNACMTRANLGYYYGELGDHERAEATLRAALHEAYRMGLHDVAASAQASLGPVLAYLGRTEDGRAIEQEAVAAFQRLGDPRLEAASRSYLARIALTAGDLAGAEREARAAAEIMSATPAMRAAAVALHAAALLGLGRVGEALVAAREAHAALIELGALEEGESLVRLVYAESLAASGQTADAADAIEAARANLLIRGGKIGNPAFRARFLRDVPENARTLSLARAWLDVERG
jgi:eukaryotic-like serine/threonine-protein kinase